MISEKGFFVRDHRERIDVRVGYQKSGFSIGDRLLSRIIDDDHTLSKDSSHDRAALYSPIFERVLPTREYQFTIAPECDMDAIPF